MKNAAVVGLIIFQLICNYATAIAGDALSQTLTKAAQLYVDGDYPQALVLWMPLAEKGDSIAQVNVGMMCAKGQVVPRDYAKAYMWFSVAANNGNSYGASYKDIISNHMTPAEISSAQRLVDAWRPK